MKKSTLEDYKKAVKAKYEEEKLGDYGPFLMNPSRAKLRELCLIIFKEGRTSNDFSSFRYFFNFDFKEENTKELKKQTDRFRPIETFFKGETDLTDIRAVDLAAVLVNFNPRPYQRFIKEPTSIPEKEEITVSPEAKNTLPAEKELTQRVSNSNFITNQYTALTVKPESGIKKQNLIWITLGVLALFSCAYTIKDFFFPAKECMQWQKDHYEVVNCTNEIQGIGAVTDIKPKDDSELKLKKITVNKKTVFFQNKKPLVWYCKKNGTPEYFNTYGFHPETGKPLKPISLYIIKKYIHN